VTSTQPEQGLPSKATTNTRRPPKPMEVRAVANGALGSALEYFDFSVYGALSATVFPILFFSGLGAQGAVLASFATFGVGFAARPLGAIIFGHLGDKFGRKPILFATLLLMGGSSIVIGLLPTGQGFAIAFLLVALRFLQGVSLGGEVIGNQLMTMEHGDKSRRGLLGSFITMGSPISQVFANLALAALSAGLTEEQFMSWGWRVPFLASILIVAVAVIIRLKLEETPAFIVSKKAEVAGGHPSGKGIRVLKTHPLMVTKLVLAWGGPALAFTLVAVYGLNYMTKTAGFASDTSFLILMIANGISVFACIVGGLMCDRIGRKPIMLGGIGGAFVGIILFFTLGASSALLAGIFITLVLCSVQFLSGAQPALFAEQFPTEVRFAGSALSHGLAQVFYNAPSAFVAAWLVGLGGVHLVMFFGLAALAASAIATSTLKEGRHLNLEQFTELQPGKEETRV
jgi:MFS family permease